MNSYKVVNHFNKSGFDFVIESEFDLMVITFKSDSISELDNVQNILENRIQNYFHDGTDFITSDIKGLEYKLINS